MANVFKPQAFKVNGENYVLEKKKLTDIFTFNSQPYICSATSGGGKTTLAIDLIYTFAKSCSNVYYITGTKETLTDDSISLIPKAFRREPTYENIFNAWNEITTQSNAVNTDSTKLTDIIIKLYGERVGVELDNRIEMQKAIIVKRNAAEYRKKGYKKDHIDSLIKNDIRAFVYETKRRAILFAFNEIKDIDEKLTIEETTIINGLVSKPSRSLLILDDLTSELEKMKNDNNKVLINDVYMSKSKAFQSLLTDILTRGRHFNSIIIFFVHSIDIFDQKENIDRFIIFDNATTQKINQIKKIPASERNEMIEASKILFSNSNYSHMFLYYRRSATNDDIKICCSKAALHVNDKLDISEQEQGFLQIYNSVLSGFKSSTSFTPTNAMQNAATASQAFTPTNTTNANNDDEDYSDDIDLGDAIF